MYYIYETRKKKVSNTLVKKKKTGERKREGERIKRAREKERKRERENMLAD